jgi:hypothetical protein
MSSSCFSLHRRAIVFSRARVFRVGLPRPTPPARNHSYVELPYPPLTSRKQRSVKRDGLAIEDNHSVRRFNGECCWQLDRRERRHLTLQCRHCATINQHDIRLVGEEYALRRLPFPAPEGRFLSPPPTSFVPFAYSVARTRLERVRPREHLPAAK